MKSKLETEHLCCYISSCLQFCQHRQVLVRELSGERKLVTGVWRLASELLFEMSQGAILA